MHAKVVAGTAFSITDGDGGTGCGFGNSFSGRHKRIPGASICAKKLGFGDVCGLDGSIALSTGLSCGGMCSPGCPHCKCKPGGRVCAVLL